MARIKFKNIEVRAKPKKRPGRHKKRSTKQEKRQQKRSRRKEHVYKKSFVAQIEIYLISQ